jgi:prephenate dehydrogenase
VSAAAFRARRERVPDPKRMSVGILGCGRFGAFLAARLARDFDVVVTDVQDRKAAAREARARWGTLEDVASCPWVVLAVPIGALRPALAALAPLLPPGAVLVEVSSVKALPSRWLRELVPPGVAAVPTHPLFGPDSARRSWKGLPLVVCPLSGCLAAARRLSADGRLRGVRVVTLPAEAHDRVMARSQALTFFLSRTLGRLDLPDPAGPLGTPSYRRLCAALASVSRDTDELYRDLVRFNPHAKGFLAEFAKVATAEAAALIQESERFASPSRRSSD